VRVLRVIARMNVGGPALQVTALADGLDPDLSLTGKAALAAFAKLEGKNMTALLHHRGRHAN